MSKETLSITEEQFLGQVLDLAHICHWQVAHFRPARTAKGWRTAVSADGAGFPDLVMLRPPRIIIAELKSEKGQMTLEQEEWFKLWRRVIPEVYLWRPGQIDEIVEVLR